MRECFERLCTENCVHWTRVRPWSQEACVREQESAKIGGHDLYVMRLKDKSDTILLSCMLQYDPAKGPGNYFPGAVDKFLVVQDKWGSEASLV